MLKTTPLNKVHRELGARMVDFGGWDMPVQYTGVIDEHLAVRNAAGLFDVSHMGEIEVRGKGALDYIQRLTTNDAAKLVDGQVQYSAMCYENGGVVDDLTLYRFADDRYLFCVNASNIEKDFAWMQSVLEKGGFIDVSLTNLSDSYAQLALQGPTADAILGRLTDSDLASLVFYNFVEGEVAGVKTVISRTGYTGESGFELYFAPEHVEKIWHALMETGISDGLQPIGLGARDTLRQEKKYALYGHELSSQITPLEGGIAWITKLDKHSFIGKEPLCRMKEAGVPRRLVGLRMTEPGVPRENYPVFVSDEEVGVVTSGTMSPSLKVGIALALIATGHHPVGTEVSIGIRNRRVAAEVVKTPFV
ncbi:MAG: glycine cleavage system aminomethyltransferase GcvT [Desulfuromonadales bacterium]|nr:glycine cleavage system aminomethyltransferase GcvT [Desulfuromonadales bacterium]